jgi:hypothetical protein
MEAGKAAERENDDPDAQQADPAEAGRQRQGQG